MNPLLSYIRHIVTYYLSKLAIAASLPAEGLSDLITYLAEGTAILVSWLVVKYLVPLVAKIKPSDLKKAGVSLLALCILSLSSCADMLKPQSYLVDTTPYSAAIAANPAQVVIDPSNVEPIGGFQAEFGARLLTDLGAIDISDRGVSGDVVIDLRSGK